MMKSWAIRISAFAIGLIVPACGDPSATSALILSPSKVFFAGPVAGPDPADQQVVMTGSDNLWFGKAAWSATSDQPWLKVSPASGTILAGQKATLTLHVGLGSGWNGATSTVGAPFADANTIPGWGAWTGSAMLIWSGDPTVPAKYYDPITDTWFGSTSTVDAPSKRSAFTAI